MLLATQITQIGGARSEVGRIHPFELRGDPRQSILGGSRSRHGNHDIRQSPGDQAQDFLHALGQLARRALSLSGGRAPEEIPHECPGQCRVYIGPARGDDADGAYQLVGGRFFEDVAGRAGAQKTAQVALIAVARKREDANLNSTLSILILKSNRQIELCFQRSGNM